MKKIFISALVVIVLTVMIFNTNAYFFDSFTSDGNRLQAGVLDIQLREMRVNASSGEREPYVGPISVMPGICVSKIVTAYNAGSVPAYVRISVAQRFELTDSAAGTAEPDLISWEIDTAKWEERNGYYYYLTPLAPGAETEPLFTQIVFPDRMGNLYEGSLAYVKVTMDAVQSSENGEDVFHASGWPASGEEGGHA